VPPHAFSANPQYAGRMYYLNVLLHVTNAADVPRVRELLGECRAGTLLEDGIARFEVYHSEADPQMFLLNEWWETKAAWETHRQGRVIQDIYLPKVLTLCTRTAHPSTLVV
jgi:quinol monooxygenase YgiN